MKQTLTLTTLGLLGSLTTSQAAFTLLDDFESYTTGAISTQSSNWSFDTADGTVAANGGNQYLSQGSTANAHTVFNNGTLLADNAIGTYFFRVQTPAAGSHHGAGVSFLNGYTNGWDDGTAIIRLSDGNNLGSEFSAYDEGIPANGNYAGLANDTIASTWYNVWVVLDNTSNRSYDVHIQSDDDANYNTQTQIGTDLEFRVRNSGTPNTPGPMESLFFRSANDGSTAHFDDLYFDSTGANLINPIPEPSAALLGSLGLLVLVRRRR